MQSYREVSAAPQLMQVMEQARANNRDLQITSANIRAVRARCRIQSANQRPDVGAANSN